MNKTKEENCKRGNKNKDILKKLKVDETKRTKGITLMALIITIIVLLILVGISIAIFNGENGILTRASDAKIETVVATVKENLYLEQIEKVIDDKEVTPESLLAEKKVKRTVQQSEDGNYYIYYALKEDAVKGMQGLGKGNVANLRDVFLIDDKLNVKYISSNGKEYGDKIEEKILEDETKIRFSNKAFSEYVSKISGATEEEMKFEWMKNQTSLTITDPAVDSLEDLVFFPNLESLTLGEYGNNIPQITTMDGVENCTKLKSLTVLYGSDKDYSAVGNLDNLATFNRFAGNDYKNIIDALKYCKSIQNVSIRNQKISDMSKVAELGNLRTLIFRNNDISKIEGLENMNNLEYLDLSDNEIIKIESLENLVNLKELYLRNNQISDITPLSKNTSLTTLDLKGNSQIDGNKSNYTYERLEKLNKIGEILDRGGEINVDIDKLGLFTNYKILDLSNQNLTTLEPIEGLTQLTTLNLNANKLTLEDERSQEILQSLKNLENLNLTNNQIVNIKAINNLNNLKLLYLQGENNNVNLVEIEDIISNLNLLTVSTQSLKTIVNCDVNKITKLRIINNKSLAEIPNLLKFEKLTDLALSNDIYIKDLSTISDIMSLKVLNLSNTNLHGRMIDFSKLTNLTYLNLRGNTLWSEDLENLKALRNNTNLTIDLSNNSIIDATALLELNPNTKINLTGNINLSQESKDKLKERFGNKVTF